MLYFQLGGPFIPLKTGRRDGRRSRAEILEEYLPDHNESMSTVLEKFSAMGIDTPGVVALLGTTLQICLPNDVHVENILRTPSSVYISKKGSTFVLFLHCTSYHCFWSNCYFCVT